MQETFNRKPNNYKTFKFFILFFTPLIFVFDILLFLYLLIYEDSKDLYTLIIFGMILVFGIPFIIIVGRNQLRSKRSYNEMSETILTLTETHLIYKFNDIEQYTIPWSAVSKIGKDNNLERFQNRIGSIMIYCDDTYSKYIRNIKKDAYVNDRNEALLISVLYVDSDYKELYEKILDYYNKYR